MIGCNGLISNNLISSNRACGIYMESIFWDNYPADECYDNRIFRNKIRNNGQDGVRLSKAWQNSFWENNITDNHGDGMGFIFSHNNTLESNNISLSRRGVLLDQSNYTKILNSTIVDQAIGGIILGQSCYGNAIEGNIISNSSQSINISAGCFENAIFANNLSLNPQPPWDGGGNFWNIDGRGNYYGQEDCRDSDSNGICDSPYLIDGGSNADRYPLARWVSRS